jgi:hypothetical protein
MEYIGVRQATCNFVYLLSEFPIKAPKGKVMKLTGITGFTRSGPGKKKI